jgi:hypothetical protein
VSACSNCLPGTYSVFTNATVNIDQCIQCGPGTYQPESGKTTCPSCPQGFYNDGNAKSACASCPEVRTAMCCQLSHICFLSFLSVLSLPIFISLNIYRFLLINQSIKQSITLRQSQFTVSVFLWQGTFVTATGAILCVDCAPGKSSTGALNGSLSCADCSAGRYSFGGSKCLPCEKGYVDA